MISRKVVEQYARLLPVHVVRQFEKARRCVDCDLEETSLLLRGQKPFIRRRGVQRDIEIQFLGEVLPLICWSPGRICQVRRHAGFKTPTAPASHDYKIRIRASVSHIESSWQVFADLWVFGVINGVPICGRIDSRKELPDQTCIMPSRQLCQKRIGKH